MSAPFAVTDLLCLRASYRPGEVVRVRVGLFNGTGAATRAALRAGVTRRASVEGRFSFPLEPLPPGASSIEIAVHPPEPTDGARYRSYGLDIVLEVQGSDAARASTAFDVSEAGREVIRYGFLSHFDGRDGQSDADLDFLLRLHITDVQLYDWMYRHDTLLPPQDEFTDPMGKPISLPVVREKIRGCHRRGMRALAYGAVYAASAAFRDEHPDWGLYDGAGQPYQLIERFFIMDIARGSPWTDHLLGQFSTACSALDLDGFHLDSYGFPRQAISGQHAEPVLRSLEEDFPEFIKEARRRLGPACRLIFNNVNGWPAENTAHAPQDALYIEVWPPHTRYQNLAELVRKARLLCRDRPVIMAAYLAPFRTAPGTTEALNAALLLISSLAALGAQHLLFGEEQGVLTQGYYVDFSTIAPGALPRLAAYCDFLVRHSEVLFHAGLRDVTATHLGGDFPAYTLTGAPISCWAQPETVWPIIRESRQRKTVSLVNLTGNASDLWNEGKAEPTPRGELELEIAVHGPVAQAWWASPDEDAGRPQCLESSLRHSADGAWLHVRLPVLRFFGLLVVEVG